MIAVRGTVSTVGRLAGRDGQIGEHAGQELAVGIGEYGARGDVARFGADAGVDRLDFALEACGRGWRRPS